MKWTHYVRPIMINDVISGQLGVSSADKLGEALGNGVRNDQERGEKAKKLKKSSSSDDNEQSSMIYTDSSTFLKVNL